MHSIEENVCPVLKKMCVRLHFEIVGFELTGQLNRC